MIRDFLLGFELEKAIIILDNNKIDYQIHEYELLNPRFAMSNKKRIMAIKGVELLDLYVSCEQEPLV
ncbi:MAG: hypothetical protein ACLFPS_01400 [Clostridia bacterium]